MKSKPKPKPLPSKPMRARKRRPATVSAIAILEAQRELGHATLSHLREAERLAAERHKQLLGVMRGLAKPIDIKFPASAAIATELAAIMSGLLRADVRYGRAKVEMERQREFWESLREERKADRKVVRIADEALKSLSDWDQWVRVEGR